MNSSKKACQDVWTRFKGIRGFSQKICNETSRFECNGIKFQWKIHNRYHSEGRKILPIHYDGVFNRAQILLWFEKEEKYNLQSLMQTQEELMKLPIDFLEEKCGKMKVVKGSLNPDLLLSLSDSAADERKKTMYAVNAAQRDAQQYPGQNIVIDEAGISITVVGDWNLLFLHGYLHETNRVVVEKSREPLSDPSSTPSTVSSPSSSSSESPSSSPNSTPESLLSIKLGRSGKKTVANQPFDEDTYPNCGTALDPNQQMYENSQA